MKKTILSIILLMVYQAFGVSSKEYLQKNSQVGLEATLPKGKICSLQDLKDELNKNSGTSLFELKAKEIIEGCEKPRDILKYVQEDDSISEKLKIYLLKYWFEKNYISFYLKAIETKKNFTDKTLTGYYGNLSFCAFLPNGNIAIAYSNGIVKICGKYTGECLHTLTGNSINGIEFIVVLPNGNLVTGPRFGAVKIWDINTGKCLHTLIGHSRVINSIVALPNGNVVTGSEDETVKIWDVNTGSCLRTLYGCNSPISSVAALPNGNIVTGSRYGTVKVWDVNTGSCFRTITRAGDIKLLIVLQNHDIFNGYVVIVSRKRSPEVWNVNTGERLHTLTGCNISTLTSLHYAYGTIISTTFDEIFKIWEIYKSAYDLFFDYASDCGDITVDSLTRAVNLIDTSSTIVQKSKEKTCSTAMIVARATVLGIFGYIISRVISRCL